MKTEEMLPIAEKMDKVGFMLLECGVVLHSMHVYDFEEDPWDRLRA